MKAQAWSELDVRNVMQSIVEKEPTISLSDAVVMWKWQMGPEVDESLLSRLTNAYRLFKPVVVPAVGAPRARTGPARQTKPRRSGLDQEDPGWIWFLWLVGNTIIGFSVAMGVFSMLFTLQNAVSILFLAVACTAGVSLVGILPLSWLIGWGVTSGIRLVFSAVRDAS